MREDSISYISSAIPSAPLGLDSLSITYDSIGQAMDSIAPAQTIIEVRQQGDKLPFSFSASDGLFVFFFICFIVFTRIYREGFVYLKENIVQIFYLRERVVNYKEITTKEIWFSYFLIFQSIVLISIALYDTFIEYIPTSNLLSPLLVTAFFVVLIAIFVFLKYIWYKLFGYIFDLGRTMYAMMQSAINIFEVLGIIFFIPVLLLIYLEYWHFYIICFMLIVFLIAQIIFFIKVIVYFVKEKFSFLFLIAYLCTVEIIPYFILGVGLIYLYKTDLFNVIIL